MISNFLISSVVQLTLSPRLPSTGRGSTETFSSLSSFKISQVNGVFLLLLLNFLLLLNLLQLLLYSNSYFYLTPPPPPPPLHPPPTHYPSLLPPLPQTIPGNQKFQLMKSKSYQIIFVKMFFRL